MATKEKKNSKASGSPSGNGGASRSSRSLERYRTAGLVMVQIVLIGVVFLQLNYLSCRGHSTWDLTQNRRFTVSNIDQELDEKS